MPLLRHKQTREYAKTKQKRTKYPKKKDLPENWKKNGAEKEVSGIPLGGASKGT